MPPSTMGRPPAECDRLVVGLQPVREAIRAHGEAVWKVVVDRKGGKRLDGLTRFSEDSGVPTEALGRAELDRLSGGVRHQGALAWAPPLQLHPLASLPSEGALFIILDGITDPQNFGAVIRSAVGLGASAVIWGEHHAAPLSPATFRASAGAVEHATLAQVTSLRAALASLHERGVHTIALDASADSELPDLDLSGPVALVVGAEDVGVSRGVRRACGSRAALPMGGTIASLNASVAAAVALYEARRQRRTSE